VEETTLTSTARGTPSNLTRYIALVGLGAVPLVAASLAQIALHPPTFHVAVAVVVFLGLAIAADLRPVPMNESGKDEVSIASVFIVTTAVLFGPQYAVPLAAISIGVALAVGRQARDRFVFNVSMYAVAAACAAAPTLLGRAETSGLRLTAYVFAGAALHLFANVILVAGAISISQSVPYRKVVVPGLRHGGGAFAIMAFLAALAANLLVLSPLLLVLLAGPLFTLTLYQRSALRSRIAQRVAETDNLTGLGNHRAYQAALRTHIDDASRDGGAFSLALVDVDNFKQVNDTYGHPVGDEVLAMISELLAAAAHSQAFRFGGDEFALLFSLDEMSAYRELERIQQELALRDATPGGPVTISVGIASFPQHADGADELQRVADGALYWSKQHGKNRACLYSPSVVRIYSPQELERETERNARLRAAKNLVRFVDARDPSTANHSELVSTLAEAIGAELGLDPETLDHLRLAGLLHDLGKIGLPDAILLAPRALTDDEFDVVKQHPRYGFALLEGLGLDPVDTWVLHHHEHWNGSGYPDGLVGEEIPLGARIILVADAFEAMTADRPYGRAQSQAEAMAELRANAGTQFDPSVVAALGAFLSARPLAVSGGR
jgi:diguanylate cyclase (GGDEF)-like protein